MNSFCKFQNTGYHSFEIGPHRSFERGVMADFDVPKVGRWIVVELESHVIHVYEEGELKRTIEHFSVGRKHHLTTVNKTFTIVRRDKHHHSTKYKNALMKYAQFFTDDGQAFHAGDVTVESHGCVHLGEDDAKYLWEWVGANTVFVRIVGPYKHTTGMRDSRPTFRYT